MYELKVSERAALEDQSVWLPGDVDQGLQFSHWI